MCRLLSGPMPNRPARLDEKILGVESQLLLGQESSRRDQEEAEILSWSFLLS